MTPDLLAALVRANLVAGLAVVLVAALRLPVRRRLGAHLAYGLWALVPLTFIAALIPRRADTALDPAIGHGVVAVTTLSGLAPLAWLAGASAFVGLVAFGQLRFLRAARIGKAGPAVVGIIAPRFVTPADFAQFYSPEERALIRAHERAHIDRHDPRVNAAIALFQCVNWFNPLVHLGVALARIDQELACDATVMARYPRSRRTYAQAMVKAGLSGVALPLGCRWLAHPLEARIGMLKAAKPSSARMAAGLCGVALLAATAGLGAWLAQPLQPPRAAWRPAWPVALQIKPTTQVVLLPSQGS